MELRFLPPELRRIDEANAELCACPIWSDLRPMHGFAALIDWRLGGRLNALLKTGFLRGEVDEIVLVPGKPHVPFEKVLLFGLGARVDFDERAFREAVLRMAAALAGMRVRRAVVELPGRAAGAIDAERAITLTLDCLGASPDHDAWWLVEDAAAQGRVEQRAADERRRVRAS